MKKAMPVLLRHPALPWILDATQARVSEDALDALPWDRVFDEMDAIEAGSIANADEDRQVGHFWLREQMMAPTMGQARDLGEGLEAVRRTAEEVRNGAMRARQGRFTDLIWIGIGGSALGPRVLCEAVDGDGLRPWFFDNIDPDGIHRTLDAIGDRLKTALCVVASKSGTTPEPMAAAKLVQERLEAHGWDDPRRWMAVTVPGSALDVAARKAGWRASVPTWEWIGGRFSTLAPVGLLPAALCGIDPDLLLGGARHMDGWTRHRAWRNNPAALLAGLWMVQGGGRGDKHLVVMPYRDRLSTFARYLQQLLMESVGKGVDRDGRPILQGLTVLGNKGSTDQHAIVQQLREGRDDFIALLVQCLDDGEGSTLEVTGECDAGDLLQGFLLGTRRALFEAGRPVITLTMQRADAAAMGGLIALFERAVSMYGALINVNAYNQPGVEAGKRAARDVLTLSRRIRAASTTVAVSAKALAEQLDADPMETWYVCERLVHTRRLARDGDAPPKYRLPRGNET
jgi:glucose-6-phosphate isomerase